MRKWFYKNLRRLRKPIYTLFENRRIQELKQSEISHVDYDKLFLDTRHQYSTNIEKIRSIGVRMLKTFNAITTDKEIEYFLFWGTLLGCVRHKGYIPWDDDLDIAMTRSQFNKLKNHLHLIPLSMEIICMDYGFYKIMDKYSLVTKDGKRGVGLDIFIIEDSDQKYKFHNVHSYYFDHLTHEQLYPTKLALFENENFPIPNKSREILTIKYGDFMKLPPLEKRVFPHLGSDIKIFEFPHS